MKKAPAVSAAVTIMNKISIIFVMHLAINGRELPPKSLQFINPHDGGIFYIRGKTKVLLEQDAAATVLKSVKDGDVVEYDLTASNDQRAKGKARINHLRLGGWRSPGSEFLIYYFYLMPTIEVARN